MKSKRPIRKRSFLLFELLISLALISLCLFPLLRPHAQMRKVEMQGLATLYFEREAVTASCILKELLYDHKIPWKQLASDEKIVGKLDETFSFLDNDYTCTYELLNVYARKRMSKETLTACEATLTFQRGSHKIGPYIFVFTVGKKAT